MGDHLVLLSGYLLGISCLCGLPRSENQGGQAIHRPGPLNPHGGILGVDQTEVTVTYADRREQSAKWRTKRFNKYLSAEMFTEVKRQERSLYNFCCTDVRLCVLFTLSALNNLVRMWRWSGDQHNCSCKACRRETRRCQGNGRLGIPIGERKLRDSLLEEQHDWL